MFHDDAVKAEIEKATAPLQARIAELEEQVDKVERALCHLGPLYDKAITKLTALRAQIAELRAALEPFAVDLGIFQDDRHARAKAALEKVRGMPCQYAGKYGKACDELYKVPSPKWCLPCQARAL